MSTVKVFKDYHYGVLVEWQNGGQYHDSFSNIAKYYAKVCWMFPGLFIRSTTLRHSEVFQNYFIVLAIFYIILVFTDITFTTVMMIQGMNAIQSTYLQMIVFLTFYPLAGMLSPVFGIISVSDVRLTLQVILCKPFFYRGMAYMNALSLLSNLSLYILTDIIVTAVKGGKYYLLYAWILLATKILLAQLVSVQTANFRNPKYHQY